MSRLVFKYIRDTVNIGDSSCCPLVYFTFDNAVALDLDQPSTPCGAVIFGGGKTFGSIYCKLQPNSRQAKHRIVWGVSTVQSSVLSLRYVLSRRSMDLVGSRDFGYMWYEFAPCVTCVSPLFDTSYEIKHPVVTYLHKGKTKGMGVDIPAGVPVLENNCASMQQSQDFIGRGEVVVSNSYHGVYWALLLGRKVIFRLFSKKFNHYRLPPLILDPKTWRENLQRACRQYEMLDLCRDATSRCHWRVREMFAS